MNLNFLVKEESRLSDITDKILNFSNSNLFLLYGKMGVGKKQHLLNLFVPH